MSAAFIAAFADDLRRDAERASRTGTLSAALALRRVAHDLELAYRAWCAEQDQPHRRDTPCATLSAGSAG